MAETTPTPEVSPEQQLEAQFARRYAEPSPRESAEESDDGGTEPADEPEASASDTADDSDDAPAAERPDAEADDDGEEVDLDGELFKLPKKVKDAVLRQKDYTQKTQELASIKRIAQDRADFYEANNALMQQAFGVAAEVKALQGALQQFQGVNWSQLVTDEPQKAIALNLQRQQVMEALQARQQQLSQYQQHINTTQAQHKAKQLELGQQELQRRIGSLDGKTRETLAGMASELGYDERDLMSPAALHALHMAAKYKALVDSKPQIQKKVAQARAVSAPAARTSQSTAESSKVAQLKARAQKGNPKDVEAFLAARFASKMR